MHTDIIQKYNIPVPRYTSYPPANYFRTFTENEYIDAIKLSDKATNNHLSFYFHIPFCKHLCHYCGCNSFPMGRPEVVEEYVKALHKEIDLLLPLIDKKRLIAQIHYGGGSPTALPVHHLRELNEHLLGTFQSIDRPEIAIECHPGYLNEHDWKELTSSGFNRYSIGVQDFNEVVLKNVNRRSSLIPMEEIFSLLRSTHASINLDLLYGLPGQTAESFGETVDRAISLQPDRLVTFSYAHVPWVNKRQLILEKIGLPTSEEKERMFAKASEHLHRAGYQSIGMDHFVLPQDELNLARTHKQLHRNFQGYCTRRTTAQVYAFGVTGISQLDTAYAQNTKEIGSYIDCINRGTFATAKGYILNHQEQITKEVIEALMCNYYLNWNELATRLSLSVSEIKAAINYDENRLTDFQNDGLIHFNDEELTVTDTGSPFVRNVAASLDNLMINPTRSFSKPI